MIDIEKEAARVAEQGESAPRQARDPVNLPMIRNWLEAIGDEHPGYTEVAPPAMVQVWTMNGLKGVRADDDPLGAMMAILDEAGFTSVVATNSDQTYHRYLKVGEQLSVTTLLEDVTGPKKTALGEGWFVTTRSTWYVEDEPVAEMRFRVLKFRPAEKPVAKPQAAPAQVIRPSINKDTEYFWEGCGRRSCASNGAAAAACYAIHQARCARNAVPPNRSTSSRTVAARSTATSCTTTRRCRASRRRS